MVISPVQCYYIGATDIAATMLIREVTRPLSFSKPVEKICEDLKKKDQQICELRYGECISQLLNLIFGMCGYVRVWCLRYSARVVQYRQPQDINIGFQQGCAARGHVTSVNGKIQITLFIERRYYY